MCVCVCVCVCVLININFNNISKQPTLKKQNDFNFCVVVVLVKEKSFLIDKLIIIFSCQDILFIFFSVSCMCVKILKKKIS